MEASRRTGDIAMRTELTALFFALLLLLIASEKLLAAKALLAGG